MTFCIYFSSQYVSLCFDHVVFAENNVQQLKLKITTLAEKSCTLCHIFFFFRKKKNKLN